jgi:thiol-disulfide isomerase/thioredoxin
MRSVLYPRRAEIARMIAALSKNVSGVALMLALLCAPCAGAGELRPWTGGGTPALVLKDLQGSTHDLAQYRGKVVLVNFWATWCEPCRDEMPSMQQLKRKLAGRPFEVLAVNLAESENKVNDFLRRLPLDFAIVLDRNGKARRNWKVKLLPTSFVIAPDGGIRYSVIGDLNWADELAVAGLLRLVPAQ